MKVDKVRQGRLFRRLDLDRRFYLCFDLDLAGARGACVFVWLSRHRSDRSRRCGTMVSTLYPPPWRLGVGGVFDPFSSDFDGSSVKARDWFRFSWRCRLEAVKRRV